MNDSGRTAGGEFLSVATSAFARYKQMGERVFEQLDDEDFFYVPDDESNSMYVIIKHMAGNMRSRWTDFLTSDGEKPDRNRDAEFVGDAVTREQIMALWESGWRHVFHALASLDEADLLRTVQVRGEPCSVVQAITQQLGHYAQHVGQMSYVGKHLKGERWVSLSIPKKRPQG